MGKRSQELHTKIAGTPEHENRKEELRKRSQELRTKIAGTPEHENRKEEMGKRSQELRTKIAGTPEHEKCKVEMRKNSQKLRAKIAALSEHKKQKKLDFTKNIKTFTKDIQNGPYFICVVCNRCLYRKSVLISYESKYVTPIYFSRICCYDGCQYICKTCDSKLKKRKNSVSGSI